MQPLFPRDGDPRPERPQRVLVVCADPGVPLHGPSGASAHLRAIASAFANQGHQVTVATVTPHDHRGRYAVDFDLPAVFCGRTRALEGLRGLVARVDAHRLARRAGTSFDLIYERASLHGDAGLRLARRCGARHLLEVNAPLDLERRRAGQLARVVRGTDRVIAVSAWIASWARERGAREVVLVPNASELRPIQVERADGLRLVHHGSVRPWHGVAFLPRLLEALPEARLTLVGGRTAPHPRIDFEPWLPGAQLARVLSAAHVGLLPYPHDAPPWLDPLKLADYRNLGIPTVGSIHPAAAGADRQVGLQDPQGWAEAVRQLARAPRCPRPRTWESVLPLITGAP